MDLSTFLGVISGIGLILLAILQKNSPIVFVDLSSFMIVCGGTFASTLMSFSFRSVFSTILDASRTFKTHKLDLISTINEIMKVSVIYRTEGHLALERVKVNDSFLRKGLILIVDNVGNKTFNEIMLIERETLLDRQRESWIILEKMGDLAPSWGLIGTLIGLVLMMLDLKSPDQIGRGMSISLLTTFYGAVMSNLIFVPLATKIENRTKKSALGYKIIFEGLNAIQRGESHRMIKEKLMGFLFTQDKLGFTNPENSK